MRKALLLIVMVVFSGVAMAQQGSVTLLTFAGYTFDDKLDFARGYGKITGDFQWGAGLEFGLGPDNAVEVIYQLHSTQGELVSYYNSFEERGELNIHYVLVGGTRYFPINETISGFGSFDAGLGILSPGEDVDVSNTTKFAWGLRGGFRIAPANAVSIRLHAQLLSPVQGAGGGFYFGSGGSGVGVSTYSTIYQFNVGGSLNFRIR